MRTFAAAAILFAAVSAQDEERTTGEAVEDSWKDVKNWFAATTSEYLTLEQVHKPFGSYTTEKTQNMKSTVSWDSTALGVNFVTVAMDLSSDKAAHWAVDSYTQVYF